MERSGGRPKKETTGFEKEKTTGYFQKKPNVNEKENVKEKDNENENASDSCIDGLQEVVDFYNNNIGTITPYALEVLENYIKELNKELVIYAMQISVEANKKTIQYIKAILNNWQKAGIKTLVEAKEESSKRKTKVQDKSSKYNIYEQREYSDLDAFYENLGGNKNEP